MKILQFTSLRNRILIPLLGTALTAAVVVAIVSAEIGKRWAMQEVQSRFVGIQSTLGQSTFPLTKSVLQSIADLTGTELVTAGEEGQILTQTLVTTDEELVSLSQRLAPKPKSHQQVVRIGQRSYLLVPFQRSPSHFQNDRAAWVGVLFDQHRIDASGRRAAMLPLATGISTILLLSTVMVWITRAMVRRLVRLEQSVKRVAEGDFNTTVSDETVDEIGQLGSAVDSMSRQLNKLWQQVHRQQRAKLLHQIASGMAHQLRNTLTGSRMAVELHRQSCSNTDRSDLDVAISQMDVAEDYIRRLLQLGSGQQEKPQSAPLRDCLFDLRSSHDAIAKHLRVTLNWHGEDVGPEIEVADGASFSAAISNLILNALQTAQQVDVDIKLLDQRCTVEVSDNGPGVASEIAGELFEPFVSSKPEGMGLGLPLVKRAAEQLGGSVTWQRLGERTVFHLECRVQSNKAQASRAAGQTSNATVAPPNPNSTDE